MPKVTPSGMVAVTAPVTSNPFNVSKAFTPDRAFPPGSDAAAPDDPLAVALNEFANPAPFVGSGDVVEG